MPGEFSADGRFVLASVGGLPSEGTQRMSIALIPLDAAPTGESRMTIVTTHVGQNGLLRPALAPGGRWIAFEVQGHTARIAVVGSRDGLWTEPQAEASWRYLDSTAMYGPHWSADGRLLYFTSTRGGLSNVWAAEFEPISGTIGQPFQVTAFNGADDGLATAFSAGAMVRGRLVLPTVRPTGAIWLVQRPR